MRVCLLTDQDIDDLPLPDGDWPCDPRSWLPEADWTLAVLEKETAVQEVVRHAREGFDLFFNLCDGAWDEGRVGIEIIQTMERLGVAFTGAASWFYEPSREAMKLVCAALGIDSPAHVLARSEADIVRALDTLRFPLFVKHPSSYASTGITRDSLVRSEADLELQCARTIGMYGSALIEEFIEGSECTVLVAEDPDDPGSPRTFTPIEYDFPEGESFKHEALKWVDYDGLGSHPVSDRELEERVRRASSRFFLGMRGTGYGRCDLRVDRDGRPWMLEINPNCGLYYPEGDYGSADLCLAADPMGHGGFTRLVTRAALERRRKGQRRWRVLPRAGTAGDPLERAWGVFATCDAEPGQVIVPLEETPHRVVRGGARGPGGPVGHDPARPELGWAWPLTESTWLSWGPDPDHWRPFAHSCDPNCWLDDLDIVARVPLRAGEELTLDHATFLHEDTPPRHCACGADRCRGTVSGRDILLPDLAMYGDHLSEYVRARREAAQITSLPQVTESRKAPRE